MATITNYHKHGGLKQYTLSNMSESQKSKIHFTRSCPYSWSLGDTTALLKPLEVGRGVSQRKFQVILPERELDAEWQKHLIFTVVCRELGLVPDNKWDCSIFSPFSKSEPAYYSSLYSQHLAYCLEIPYFLNSKTYIFHILIVLKSGRAFNWSFPVQLTASFSWGT